MFGQSGETPSYVELPNGFCSNLTNSRALTLFKRAFYDTHFQFNMHEYIIENQNIYLLQQVSKQKFGHPWVEINGHGDREV